MEYRTSLVEKLKKNMQLAVEEILTGVSLFEVDQNLPSFFAQKVAELGLLVDAFCQVTCDDDGRKKAKIYLHSQFPSCEEILELLLKRSLDDGAMTKLQKLVLKIPERSEFVYSHFLSLENKEQRLEYLEAFRPSLIDAYLHPKNLPRELQVRILSDTGKGVSMDPITVTVRDFVVIESLRTARAILVCSQKIEEPAGLLFKKSALCTVESFQGTYMLAY
jgi:hypothetical protein